MTTTALIQIPLLKPDQLDPLPVDDGHYLAVVQSKTGERHALANALPSTWARLTPLVEVVGPKTPKPPLTETSVAAWMLRLSKALGAHPFYLDIMRLDPTLSVTGKNGQDPVLARMYAEARKRAMRFVPVVHVGESGAAHVQLVADAALEHGNGVGLRYRIRTVLPPAGKTHREVLSAQLDDLGAAVTDADLLVDLAFLDEDDEVHPHDIADALREMCAVGEWRCLVVIGTSIPKMLSCVKEGSVGSIPRREWDLWSGLAKCDLPRMPAFGDYAIQNPDPPAEDIAGNTMRANIRYTAATETIVARGRGPVSQEGNEQYQDLCDQLVKQSEFSGAAYSWGDTVIDECANCLREPGLRACGVGPAHRTTCNSSRTRCKSCRSSGKPARRNPRLTRVAADESHSHGRPELRDGCHPEQVGPQRPTRRLPVRRMTKVDERSERLAPPEQAHENLGFDSGIFAWWPYRGEGDGAVDVNRRQPPPVGEDDLGLFSVALRDDGGALIEEPAVCDDLAREALEGVALRLDLEAIHRVADDSYVRALVGARHPKLVEGVLRPSDHIHHM